MPPFDVSTLRIKYDFIPAKPQPPTPEQKAAAARELITAAKEVWLQTNSTGWVDGRSSRRLGDAIDNAERLGVAAAPVEVKRTVLEEAGDVAGQDRSRDYGHPKDNFQRIADIWTTQLETKLKEGEEITPRDTALMMVGLKLAREINTSKRDNLVDICGYIKCLEMIDPSYEK